MAKKKYYLILDVETAGTTDEPLVYDLGWAIADSKGNIYKEESYIISDIFFEGNETLKASSKMETAYYNKKLPKYYKGIKRGDWKIGTFYNVRKKLLEDAKKYNVTAVCAYNASFDTKALNNTMSYLTKGRFKWFFPYETPVMCIWHMACQLICTMKKYKLFCEENGFVSQAGNYQTSTEVVWRFLTGNTSFEEEHTGLEDVRIETQIMKECFKKHKKFNKGINRMCWRIPQKKKGK